MPNGGKRSKKEAAILKAEGVTAGVADLFLPWPRVDRTGRILYCGLYLEIKSERDNLKPAQCAFRDHCQKARFKFVVVRSAQQGIDTLLDYLGGE